MKKSSLGAERIKLMQQRDTASLVVGFAGFMVFCICLGTMTGYAADWQSGYYWFGFAMAPNTATFGMIAGGALMITGYKLNAIWQWLKKLANGK